MGNGGTLDSKEGQQMAKVLKTVEVKGPEGRIIINQEDLKRYTSKGYEVVEAEEVLEEETAEEPDDEEDED